MNLLYITYVQTNMILKHVWWFYAQKQQQNKSQTSVGQFWFHNIRVPFHTAFSASPYYSSSFISGLPLPMTWTSTTWIKLKIQIHKSWAGNNEVHQSSLVQRSQCFKTSKWLLTLCSNLTVHSLVFRNLICRYTNIKIMQTELYSISVFVSALHCQ